MEPRTQDAVSPDLKVPPETNAPPEPNASPEHNTTQRRQRCRARRRDRKQCRLYAQDPATGLCARHASYAESVSDEFRDTTDLSQQILVVNEGGYSSIDSIHAILSNVVELLAKGRISPRRASVITFALSLTLRGTVAAERIAANAPPQIIWDAPRPKYDDDHPASAAQSGNPADAKLGAEAHQEPSNGAKYNAPKTYADVRS